MKEAECRKIYREAFFDSNDFEDRLFSFCSNYCESLEVNNKTASILFALPTVISSSEFEIEASYIFAVATAKEMQGRGYMSQLIKELQQKNDKLLFLKPTDSSLVSFYEKLGFITFTASTETDIGLRATAKDGFEKLIQTEPPPKPQSYTAMYYYKKDINLNNLFFPHIME